MSTNIPIGKDMDWELGPRNSDGVSTIHEQVKSARENERKEKKKQKHKMFEIAALPQHKPPARRAQSSSTHQLVEVDKHERHVAVPLGDAHEYQVVVLHVHVRHALHSEHGLLIHLLSLLNMITAFTHARTAILIDRRLSHVSWPSSNSALPWSLSKT